MLAELSSSLGMTDGTDSSMPAVEQETQQISLAEGGRRVVEATPPVAVKETPPLADSPESSVAGSSVLESRRSIEVDTGTAIEGELYRHAVAVKDGYEGTEIFTKEKKKALECQAKSIQEGLAALVERIQVVQAESEKLESENHFLQDYIGNLMSTGNLLGEAPKKRR